MLDRLEKVGVTSLHDLVDADPFELVARINDSVGHTIWRPPLAVAAMANLIEKAQLDASVTPRGRERPR